MYKDVFVDTVICDEVNGIPANRFVTIDGKIGGDYSYGVTRLGGKYKQAMDVIVLGIAEVEIASGQTLNVGDRVIANAEGKAALTDPNNYAGFFVKKINNNLAEIILR